jgi:predicted RNA-binding Zn ribbon-like protein
LFLEKTMLENNETTPRFEFSGGWLCLDFANTLEERLSAAPVEQIATYEALLAWCQQAELLDSGEVARLRELARARPAEAANWLASIKQARELIYRIFHALASGESAGTGDIRQFNQLLAETMAHACLVPGENGFAWGWSGEQERLECPLWFVVRSAADLLTSLELRYVRVCASEECGWLFLDTSKNHSRRWCDMKSCGNRAKARRHYGRKKEPAGE